MTLKAAARRKDRLVAILASSADLLRGSLIERTTFHSSGCQKCARGEGHTQSVLTITYPGAKNRQISLRPTQIPAVRKAVDRYRQVKEALEEISEINQHLLRLERDEERGREA